MKVHSTRSLKKIEVSQAILNGLAEDGGLYVWDELNPSFFNDSFFKLNYDEVAFKFFKYFLSDFTDSQINEIIKITLSNKFQPDYFTLTHFNNASLLNLFHGPTFSFKDMALSLLPHLMKYAKDIHNISKKTVILTATSGDTGGAALEGFKDDEDVIVIVLYPKNNISIFQEKQMQSYRSEKAFVIGVDGDFDQCQAIVKSILNDPSNDHILLSSANSINVGRIIVQMHYYIQSYLRLVREKRIKQNEKIDIIVPSGNFGNMYAATIAKRLGLPIQSFVVATNENNVLSTVFNQGIYEKRQKLRKTLTPAMDILVSSNLERYIYDQIKNPSIVKQLMERLNTDHEIDLSHYLKDKDIFAYEVNDTETLNSIVHFFKKYQRVIDPHTAVGLKAHEKFNSKNYALAVATASPYKFQETIEKAFNWDKEFFEKLIEPIIPNDPRIHKVLDTEITHEINSAEKVINKIKKVLDSI